MLVLLVAALTFILVNRVLAMPVLLLKMAAWHLMIVNRLRLNSARVVSQASGPPYQIVRCKSRTAPREHTVPHHKCKIQHAPCSEDENNCDSRQGDQEEGHNGKGLR